MRNDRVHWGRPLAAAMVLVLWVAVASFWVTEQVNRQEEQASFAPWPKKRTSWPAASRSGWTATGRS